MIPDLPASIPKDPFTALLFDDRASFAPVVPYRSGVTRCVALDLSGLNADFPSDVYTDVHRFTAYIDGIRAGASADYGIGGYAEERDMYARSRVFDAGEEPRRLHLGIDIWASAGTPVYAPLEGVVHSVAMHRASGDYGGALILRHSWRGEVFHTLYGHLAEAVTGMLPGDQISRGRCIAHLGVPAENGNWPPHLHFQLIRDMEGFEGDYPGVCRRSERDAFLTNCPDPASLLGFVPFS